MYEEFSVRQARLMAFFFALHLLNFINTYDTVYHVKFYVAL